MTFPVVPQATARSAPDREREINNLVRAKSVSTVFFVVVVVVVVALLVALVLRHLTNIHPFVFFFLAAVAAAAA